MKQIFTAILLFIANYSFSQTDNNGNPVFNSITTKEEQIKDFQFISNYYTLKNNIENKESSVYVSDNPTLEQIEKAATNLPSDFFLVVKNNAVINLVLVLNKPSRSFLVVNPATGKKINFAVLSRAIFQKSGPMKL